MTTTTTKTVAAEPYAWPYNANMRPDNTALIVIDMQTDFCGKGGYVDVMGYDLSLVQAPIQPIARTLAALRPLGYHIIHTREGHRSAPAAPPPARPPGCGHCPGGYSIQPAFSQYPS